MLSYVRSRYIFLHYCLHILSFKFQCLHQLGQIFGMRQEFNFIYPYGVHPVVRALFTVKTLLSPCETTTAFVTNMFSFTHESASGFSILFCWSIHLFQCQYKTVLLTKLYNNSLYLVRQVSSPCSSSSGMSWLFLNLFSSIYILESACQVPQKTCWDFYWNCIESIYQFEEN